MAKAGRKAKLHPEDEIKAIVYRYTEENNIQGKIESKSDVYRFAQELHKKGEIPYKLSEDYWRKPNRQGRLIIDDFNEVIVENVAGSKEREVTIYNVEDVVHKHKDNPEKIIALLKANEKQLRIALDKEVKLEEKIDKLNKTVTEEKEKKRELQDKYDSLENSLFQLFEYGTSGDLPIANLLNTGKTKHKRVENALNNIFSNPDEFIKAYEKHIPMNNNVVGIDSFQKNKKQEDITQDYDF